MKKRILTAICLVGCGLLTAQAQELGFSIGGQAPNRAAILDVQAKNKGVLIPRIDLKEDTLLNGGTNPEGVIVYNTGSSLENGFYYWTKGKWEKVIGNTDLTEQLTVIRNEFETEIKNITNITDNSGSGTDKSYLVSYNPTANTFTYLTPKEGGGYDQTKIDFNEAVKVSETNTFVRELKTKINEGTPEQAMVVSAYVYFSEEEITTWLKANPGKDPVKFMADKDGTTMDVLGVMNNNFKEVLENNTTTLNNIIKNAPDNVWVEDRAELGKFLVYNDPALGKQEVSLTQQETLTEIFKHQVSVKGEAGEAVKADKLDLSELDKGAIYYSYKGEDGTMSYINMTNDIISSIENNTTLKEEIFNAVNNYTTEGGNVFYGPLNDGDTDKVLYIINDKKKKEQLDISKDIEKVLKETTNNILVETILKQTEVTIKTNSGDLAIGTSIDGAKVYSGKRSIKVFNKEDGYDVTFDGKITVNPSKKVMKEGSTDFTYESTGEKIESLISAKIILKDTKQIATNSVTEVIANATNNELSFYFGNNSMYVALENGDYEVVFEYTAK